MRIPFVGDIPEARRQARASQAEPVGEAGTVHKLEERYQASDSARRQFEGEWVDNILFLEGRQWEKAAEDVRRGRKLPVRAPESRVQMTANWTYTLARQAVAGLRDNLAEQIAVPATADPADEAAAEVATDWLAFQYDQDGEDALAVPRDPVGDGDGAERAQVDVGPEPRRAGSGARGEGALPRAGDIASVSLNPWRFHVDPWSETVRGGVRRHRERRAGRAGDQRSVPRTRGGGGRGGGRAGHGAGAGERARCAAGEATRSGARRRRS